ncbi:hypothetical protein BP00DRAFT_442655 [Aspergillus indologenus CBS 114.80]|uniref:Uncharacterized protein n=1 Tax=Aspergillus indologenus CBS 114.80 TaxID=1450541 RepID=A0A2V5IN29_9EURO|nr:hypothetical protein BP00DRAFT_442655 [Aspergillus indologenus CBS 114.80]
MNIEDQTQNTTLSFPYCGTSAYRIHSSSTSTTPGLPHLTLLAYQPKVGRENTLLHGELVALVSAMRSRAFQLKVDTEAEQEELMDADEYDATRICSRRRRRSRLF